MDLNVELSMTSFNFELGITSQLNDDAFNDQSCQSSNHLNLSHHWGLSELFLINFLSGHPPNHLLPLPAHKPVTVSMTRSRKIVDCQVKTTPPCQLLEAVMDHLQTQICGHDCSLCSTMCILDLDGHGQS